jgi:hypothetical protein
MNLKSLTLPLFFCLVISSSQAEQKSAPPSRVKTTTFTRDGIQFDVVEQAPQLMTTPLQVFGVFSFTPGDSFTGADVEMDEGFKGLIQELRKHHDFGGHLGESILLKSDGKSVAPSHVLVIGLGDRKSFKPKSMQQIGRTGIREACRLGMSEFSHASDVQDGGVHQYSPDQITENTLAGMLSELAIQRMIEKRGYSEVCHLKHITLLAGSKFYDDTVLAVQKSLGVTPQSQLH